jgi:hypothetical protein
MMKITLTKCLTPYLLIILGLFLPFSMPLCSIAAEIHVPAQISTIQAAIDASSDADTIIVNILQSCLPGRNWLLPNERINLTGLTHMILKKECFKSAMFRICC